MKFTLKDYQEEAVAEVLDRLAKARKRWHEERDKNAFSLTATTGAGKTVMAAAVIEALFFGDDENEFEPDPGAVIIWFSDDPSLNEQSRWRLHEASDKLTMSDLVTVENSFGRERFEPGKIYFLNTQKLSRNSLLVRGHDVHDDAVELGDDQLAMMPDMRAHTIWDTIRNTVDDTELTLYLVLDEAHRGMREAGRSTTNGRQTIVRQLINGSGRIPGIPIVWGISATVARFDAAIADMQGHDKMRPVTVDSRKVQDSGLIKDTIDLDVPTETGDFATALLRRGTKKLVEISEAWATYASEQDGTEPVLPLMVLQVPNSPDPHEIATWLDVVFEEWPELPRDSVANVLGEHRHEQFGGHEAPYIAPERVQESQWIRVLLAKDAISTGWDCPRAEVMVSFRPASDRTHITQLLGRMVRTPLARRIPGNERLNAVDCILPRFNKEAVEAVVTSLMSGGEAGEDLPLRRVLIRPIEVTPNPSIPAEVWGKLLTLPSQSLPRKQARPIKRLTALAHELAVDGLLPGAGVKAHAAMHAVLDQARTDLAAQIQAQRESVEAIEGTTLKTNLETQTRTFNDFVEVADLAVIEDAYKRAARSISPDLARTYAEFLAGEEGGDDALIDAHTTIAALGLVADVKTRLEQAAEDLSRKWLTDHRDEIRSLSDERRDVYGEISQMSADPADRDLAQPRSRLEATTVKEPNGTEVELPRLERHLLCDGEGRFPTELNRWERGVLEAEMGLEDRIAWYRNPSRATQDSLGIAYEVDGESAIVRPDFIFFGRTGDDEIVADIVDPHGHHLADALPKLRGLAKYAEKHAEVFRRIEAVSEIDGRYRRLDLMDAGVRSAIEAATSAKSLYSGEAGSDYG